MDDFDLLKEPTGRDIYESITPPDANSFGFSESGASGVSKKLNELGIPGIKYLDGTSRSAGKGTRNFVVFDENDITALKRNEELIR